MIIGIADGETYVASDVPAILEYSRNVYYIGNLEFAKLVPGEAHFYDLNGDEIEKQTTEIKWDAEAAEKGGFEHFMMKEIHEQPKAVQDTLNSVIKNGAIDLSSVEITEDEIKNFEQIYIVACGSAWHVGMAAQYVLEDIADIPVRVELASEFRYRKMPLNQKALVIVVSQSGETADTLAALRLAKEKGITTMAIVNVVGSSIAREADKVFYTLAGPEISVATTKAYSAQLAAMYCLSVQFAKVREKITEEQYSYYISELLTLPEKMQKTLEDKERIQWFAAKYANAHDVFFVGRGIDYAVCLEGSLKLKEISYIHSEAYAAGELKHGTISLIEQGTLVIGVLTQSELYEKTISNMLECKSRGASYILANTLRYKNYDDRFSHSNKEWAEQVGTPENNARIIKFRADWVVTSHSAVLDGFVTKYREKLEKQKELKQPFVKRFYVVENRRAVPLEIKRFGNLDDAMSHYQALPYHYMKALGVEKNPDPLPGSLDVLQCKNGLDTIVEDYKTVPGWDNPYIQNHVVQPLQGALAVQDVELAYELPDAYFYIQTCDDGFDYTLYNKDFTERDGGILETDGDKSVQEAMTELLAELGCDAAEGKVMDAAELREQVDMVAEQQAEVLKEKLAAERPAPEETLSFYVAECLEFTFAGEFHDHLTMEEALEAYDKIPSERMNADKCIGFCIEEDGGFVGMYELVVNDKVQRENINSINYFRDDKLVQQAISDMEKLMAARQQSKEQERSNTKKSVLDALRTLKAKKQEQPAQEQDKPKKAKSKGMEL